MDKKSLNRDHQEVMDLLYTVPGVKEHMAQPHVQFSLKMGKKRTQKGLTISELAELVGTTPDIIVDIEWGNPNQDQDILKKIKEILDFE